MPSVLLSFWFLGGWILFGLFYAWLATQFRIHASVNAASEKRKAAEQTKVEQEKLQKQARSAADDLLAKARSRSQSEFAERLSLLQDDLRQEGNRVSQAESVLMQCLLEKHQDAYETIHRALDVLCDHDTMYDAALYSVNAGHEREAIDLLDKCINRQPTTIITMFSESDLRSVLDELLRLAARKLQEVRERVVNVLKRCQSVLQGAADAEKLLALKFVSLRPFTTEVEVIGQRLGKADYLTCLELEKRVLQIRERLVVECTSEIQSEIANRRDAVKRMEDALRQIGHQGELILAEARRDGEALIEKARTQAETENRKARFALEASESNRTKTEQNSEFLLSLFMVLAALGMEINAGCAVYAGRRLWAELPPNAAQLRGEIAKLEQHKVAIVHSIEALEQEPQQFVNEFWRDFHQAMIKGTQRTTFTKMWAFGLFALLLLPLARAHAREPLNLVVAVDLTASVGRASGLDQKTELQHDVASIGKLLATAPAGSRVTVIGITDRSFAQPYVLLSARLDSNEGYFKERIASAHQQLLAAWQKRSQSLVEDSSQTDLLGALVMSSQVFEPKEGHQNVLVIFSDMRHETRSLNLARLPVVPVQSTLDNVGRGGLIADLNGIEVYVLGVDAAGKSVAYWNSLRDFWLAYFGKAGAKVRVYSMLRDLPQL